MPQLEGRKRTTGRASGCRGIAAALLPAQHTGDGPELLSGDKCCWSNIKLLGQMTRSKTEAVNPSLSPRHTVQPPPSVTTREAEGQLKPRQRVSVPLVPSEGSRSKVLTESCPLPSCLPHTLSLLSPPPQRGKKRLESAYQHQGREGRPAGGPHSRRKMSGKLRFSPPAWSQPYTMHLNPTSS